MCVCVEVIIYAYRWAQLEVDYFQVMGSWFDLSGSKVKFHVVPQLSCLCGGAGVVCLQLNEDSIFMFEWSR